MAGYWNLSRTQVLDQNDNLIVGARAYFFEATTSTPMTTYSSASLGEVNEHPHPVVTDGNARWPNVFFDDEEFQFYHVRVTDAGGSLIYDDDSVPIIGQAEGGGGGGPPVPVDPKALAKTGDVKLKFGPNADAGWVRLNGLTIGSSSSGATERSDADTQALFEFLWNNHNNTICPVAGGRGASATADFTADKPLTLPDMRGRAPFGTNQMGNAASSGRIAGSYMDTGSVNQVGASGGNDAIDLVANNIPVHQHPAVGGTTGTPPVAAPLLAAAHTHLMVDDYTSGTPAGALTATTPIMERGFIGSDDELRYQLAAGTSAANIGLTSLPATTAGVLISGGGALAVTGSTGNNVTTGAPHENMPPFMLFTYLIKL